MGEHQDLQSGRDGRSEQTVIWPGAAPAAPEMLMHPVSDRRLGDTGIQPPTDHPFR